MFLFLQLLSRVNSHRFAVLDVGVFLFLQFSFFCLCFAPEISCSCNYPIWNMHFIQSRFPIVLKLLLVEFWLWDFLNIGFPMEAPRKHASSTPRLTKARRPSYCTLKGVKPSSFYKPTHRSLHFLRFRLRLKTTQVRTLWKKILGERKETTHNGKTQIPLDWHFPLLYYSISSRNPYLITCNCFEHKLNWRT